MSVERRFQTSFEEEATGAPGLVLDETGSVWRVAPGGARTEVGASGGGVSTAAQSLTMNRANGWVAEHVFDLGADFPHATQTLLELATLDPDSETVGEGDGEIAIDFFNYWWSESLPPVNIPRSNGWHWGQTIGTGYLTEIGDGGGRADVIPRYLKLAAVLLTPFTGDPYAGANDPVAVVDVELQWK